VLQTLICHCSRYQAYLKASYSQFHQHFMHGFFVLINKLKIRTFLAQD
jgi:hypothetical protein